LERAGRPHDKGEKVALIYGVGAVQRGAGGFSPISGRRWGRTPWRGRFAPRVKTPTSRRSSFASTVPADRTWLRTRFGARRSSPAKPVNP
jgi:hypothetical protein